MSTILPNNYAVKFVVILLLLLIGLIAFKQKTSEQTSQNIQISQPIAEPEIKTDPEFILWSKIRKVSTEKLGIVLSDIDSHMPSGHGYSDRNKVTWAHETTHGINSNIRNSQKGFVNGFYCLNDRACIVPEPKTTISRFAREVPEVLRGPSYNLYLISQARSWNDRPLYLCDEWIAYTNGSEVGKELSYEGWYFELLQAHNFNVYCIVMTKHIKTVCPDYDDKQLRLFMMWNIERTFDLLKPTEQKAMISDSDDDWIPVKQTFLHDHILPVAEETDPTSAAKDYIQKFREAPEAEELRVFCREYFGAAWCKKVYGF